MKSIKDLYKASPQKPKTARTATWEGAEVVAYFKEHFDIPQSGSYGNGNGY